MNPDEFTVLISPSRKPDIAQVRYTWQGRLTFRENGVAIEAGSRLSKGGGLLLSLGLGVLLGYRGASIGQAAGSTGMNMAIDPGQARAHFDDLRRTISIENPAGNSFGRWAILRPRSTRRQRDQDYLVLRDSIKKAFGDRCTPISISRWGLAQYLIAAWGVFALFSLGMIIYLIVSGKAVWVSPWATASPLEDQQPRPFHQTASHAPVPLPSMPAIQREPVGMQIPVMKVSSTLCAGHFRLQWQDDPAEHPGLRGRHARPAPDFARPAWKKAADAVSGSGDVCGRAVKNPDFAF